jgi:hypothetical protein
VGPESRSAIVVLGGSFLTIGALLWVSVHSFGWAPGGALIICGILVFLSLLTGRPFPTLRADVKPGSVDGIPWRSTVKYSTDQLRQIVPHFHGDAFTEPDLWNMIPKTTRSGIIPFHEPFQNFQWREGIDVMVETGELEVISKGCWRGTGRKQPSHWSRSSHGTQTKT